MRRRDEQRRGRGVLPAGARASRLRYVTTELIDLPDYGAGAGYSLFEHSVALARWIRDTEAQLRAARQHEVTHP